MIKANPEVVVSDVRQGSIGTLRTPHVLVVDDNLAYRTLAAALLERQGIVVCLALDAVEALECLQRQSFDLVLLDLRMPGMEGEELCRLIRRQLGLRNLPVVAYTSDGLGATQDRMRAAGFDDVLAKPINQAKLRHLLADWLGGRAVSLQ